MTERDFLKRWSDRKRGQLEEEETKPEPLPEPAAEPEEDLSDEELLAALTHPGVFQGITVQHVVMQPATQLAVGCCGPVLP